MLNKEKIAPEIEFADNHKFWLNSHPLKLDRLRGKVVLLDFWTYSCINCIRTLPHLKKFWDKYKNKRFTIIGIHTPEFEFEKEIGNVKYAVKKYGISYPVLSDPSRNNWENYGNTYWPRIALIDTEGRIVYEHVGEGNYYQVEMAIMKELEKLKEVSKDFEPLAEKSKLPPIAITKEVYAGKTRNTGLGSSPAITRDGINEYIDSGSYVLGAIYLQGPWMQHKESLEFAGQDYKGWIALKYYAQEVNVVMSGVGIAEVLLNNFPILTHNAGKDIIFQDGKSLVKLEGPDMYNLVKHTDFHSHVLTIKPFNEMKVYSYTFG